MLDLRKIAVRIEADEISLPLVRAPSTHILTPSIERCAGVVSNEALIVHLASRLAFRPAKSKFAPPNKPNIFLWSAMTESIMSTGSVTTLERLHQEDFCQALNVVPEMKYQKEGGPSLKQCFELVREVSSAPVIDLARLLDTVIYNYLIGNSDAHGKNFSLLYHQAGPANQEIRLAPPYDVISTVY